MRTPVARGLLALFAVAAIAACGQKDAQDEEDSVVVEESSAEPTMTIYEAAVASESRPDADRARDANRKPAEVLEYVGIEPGMTVLDLFTGGGYYADILAHIVGSEGIVIAQTNEAYRSFGGMGEQLDARVGENAHANIEVLIAENNELSLEPDSIDAAMLVMSYHDLYLVDEENGWPVIDVAGYLAEIRKGLRAGGTFTIIDHVGAAGISAEESGNSVHRIDPALVVTEMQKAGFKLVGESDLLRNPDDDHSQLVFADGIRGKTDRFLMVFESPD